MPTQEPSRPAPDPSKSDYYQQKLISFDPTATTAPHKAELVAQIKAVQENLAGLLGSNDNQIKSHVASSFDLTDEQATVILENLMVSPGPETLLKKLADESLIALNVEGEYDEINSTNFPDLFSAYALLHKVSLVVSRLKIQTKDLEWFIANFATVNTLDFSALPLAVVSPNDFDKWLNLFFSFSSNPNSRNQKMPRSEASLIWRGTPRIPRKRSLLKSPN